MITRIDGGRIIADGRVSDGKYLYMDGGMIAEITKKKIACDAVIDAGGLYVSPGFVDIHTHGGGGADFMDGTADAFRTVAAMHARYGTTTLIPTGMSASIEELRVLEGALLEARKAETGADMPGLHLEGPYLASSQRGAQDEKYIRLPEPEEYLPLLDASRHILRWTAAPEVKGGLAFGKELRSRGIVASIGHTEADYADVERAVASGYSHVTHLYSCMNGVHRVNAYRVTGAIEASLMNDSLTVEIIADGAHLPGEMLRYVYRVKGPEKTALVTDSMRAAGMGDGESILGSLQNGQKVYVKHGVAWMPDGKAFAGSVATMDRLVRNMVNLAEVPLVSAVTMATETPCRVMKLNDRGKLEPGRRADVVLFDDDIIVKHTIVAGKTVY